MAARGSQACCRHHCDTTEVTVGVVKHMGRGFRYQPLRTLLKDKSSKFKPGDLTLRMFLFEIADAKLELGDYQARPDLKLH